MNRILLVCSSKKSTKVYADSLKSLEYTNIDTEDNGAAVRRKLIQDEYNLVIIDSPLKDEQGNELAIKISSLGDIGVILVVKSENAEAIAAKVEDYGVFILSKPLNKALLYQGVKFVFTSLKRVNILRKEKNNLIKQVENIKRVDKAKCLLIQYENMTEEEAHKYIQNESMNRRLTRREIAEKIIKYYGV